MCPESLYRNPHVKVHPYSQAKTVRLCCLRFSLSCEAEYQKLSAESETDIKAFATRNTEHCRKAWLYLETKNHITYCFSNISCRVVLCRWRKGLNSRLAGSGLERCQGYLTGLVWRSDLSVLEGCYMSQEKFSLLLNIKVHGDTERFLNAFNMNIAVSPQSALEIWQQVSPASTLLTACLATKNMEFERILTEGHNWVQKGADHMVEEPAPVLRRWYMGHSPRHRVESKRISYRIHKLPTCVLHLVMCLLTLLMFTDIAKAAGNAKLYGIACNERVITWSYGQDNLK